MDATRVTGQGGQVRDRAERDREIIGKLSRKINAIEAMMPRLREVLPSALFGELAAQVYLLVPSDPPTAQEVATARAWYAAVQRTTCACPDDCPCHVDGGAAWAEFCRHPDASCAEAVGR